MKMKQKLPSVISEPYARETIFDGLDVSETTRKEYLARIGLFISFVNSRGFGPHSYLYFKRYLAGRNDYSVSTKNKYLTTARVFLRELQRRGKLPFDVTYSVKHFRQTKRHKREGLSDKEIRLLGVKLKYLPSTPRNSRLRALFSLLAYQGLRQIEIVRLNVEDINLAKGVAYVRGKGEDDRDPIYLTPATVKALESYLETNKITSGSLFRSMGNRKRDRLSTMTIKRDVGELMKQIGIEKTVHGFRHFYVTELLKTMDVRDVRKFSRHRSMEMLIVYDDEISVKQKTKHVFEAMEKFAFA